LELARRHDVPAQMIGRVVGTRLAIHPWIDAPIEDLNDAWRSGLARTMHVSG